MEINYTKTQLLEAYGKLPSVVQEAISSINMVATITQIEKKYNLHLDQAGALAHETGLVLVGLASPNSFTQNIQRKLFLTSDQAKEIAATVNLEIFSRVQEKVKELSEGSIDQTPTASPEAAEKVSQLFTPAPQEAKPPTTPKPWDEDPYLEKP